LQVPAAQVLAVQVLAAHQAPVTIARAQAQVRGQALQPARLCSQLVRRHLRWS
jgi:hypothetical protein